MEGLQLKLDKKEAIKSTPMKSIMSLMPLRVDPKKAEGVQGTLVLNFVDTKVNAADHTHHAAMQLLIKAIRLNLLILPRNGMN